MQDKRKRQQIAARRKEHSNTYLKATGVLELVPLIARLCLEVGIASQHLLSPLLNILRILKDLHLLGRYLVHGWPRSLKYLPPTTVQNGHSGVWQNQFAAGIDKWRFYHRQALANRRMRAR